MATPRFNSIVARFKSFSTRKKLVVTLAIVALLALPAFAVANADAVRPIVAQVQEFFTGSQMTTLADSSNQTGAGDSSPAFDAFSGVGQREVIQYSFGSDGSGSAITTDGSLWTWGGNVDGRLGLGDTIARTTPQRVEALGVTSWIYVSMGARHTLAIDQDNRLWAWGQNTRGQVGNGNTTHQHLPVMVTAGATSWATVDGGNDFSLAIDTDGNLWRWGSGVVLDGGESSVPQLVTTGAGLGNWQSVSAGQDHAAAIDVDGNIWTWGNNQQGRLGIGVGSGAVFITATPTPIYGNDLPAFTYVSAGQWHTLALGADGSIWSWGHNQAGQLGRGATMGAFDQHTIPLPLATPLGATGWSAVSSGTMFGLGIDDQGRLWGWGSNQQGNLGMNTASGGIMSPAGNFNNPILIPVDVGPTVYINNSGQTMPSTWQSVSAGWGGATAMCENGVIWTWGANGATSTTPEIGGQLGKGILTSTPNSQQGQNTNNWRPWRIAGSLVPTGAGNSTNWQTPNTGTIPNHLATNVSQANTPYVYIFFDRLMCTEATSRGTITFIPEGNPANAIVVDLTNFEWASTQAEFNTWPPNHPSGPMDHPNRGVQSVFRVPLPVLEPNTQYLAVVEGFLCASFGVRGINEMYPHGTATLPTDNTWHGMYPDRPWTFTTADEVLPPPPEVSLTKILEAPAGTTIPSARFEFRFTPVQVVLNESPLEHSRPTAEVPAISPDPYIIIDPGSAVTSGTVTTATGSLDLWALINGLTFPGMGTFVWNVHEVRYSSNTTSPSYMDYDDARWQVTASVNANGALIRLEARRLVYDDGQWIPYGNKTDTIIFENTYYRTTDLEIGKLVPDTPRNEFADPDEQFTFTLTLEAHALAALNLPITATVVDSAGNPVSPARTVDITGTTTNFTLSSGETLRIPGLPIGTIFTVTEAPHPHFSPSARVTVGGVEVQVIPRQAQNTELVTDDHTLADGGANVVQVENDLHFIPPTGLIVNNGFGIALITLAVLAIFAGLVFRARRRAIEQLPIV